MYVTNQHSARPGCTGRWLRSLPVAGTTHSVQAKEAKRERDGGVQSTICTPGLQCTIRTPGVQLGGYTISRRQDPPKGTLMTRHVFVRHRRGFHPNGYTSITNGNNAETTRSIYLLQVQSCPICGFVSTNSCASSREQGEGGENPSYTRDPWILQQ